MILSFFEKSVFNSLIDMMTMYLFLHGCPTHGCPTTGRHNPCLMSVAQVLELLFPISDIQHQMQYKCLGFSVIPVCIYIINTWFAGCVHVSVHWNDFWQHSFITVGEQPQMQRICIQSDLMAYAFSLVFEYWLLSVVKLYHISQVLLMMLHIRKTRSHLKSNI